MPLLKKSLCHAMSDLLTFGLRCRHPEVKPGPVGMPNADRAITFNCSHLTPCVGDQRMVQAKELLAYYRIPLEKFPLLICGDLNAVPASDAIKTLLTEFAPSDPYFQSTFNTRKSLTKKIDYILYPQNGLWTAVDFKRLLEMGASDRRAILSVLRYEPD